MPAPDTPLISIITITLNDRDGLLRTVESLRAQENAPEIEHIVVDGMSDYDVAQALCDLGSQARLHRGRDSGLYDAMNRGTEMAGGDYLLYLNSGDVLAGPDVLASVAKVLRTIQPDFFWGDSLERQLDGTVRHKHSRPIRRLPLGMITHHQAMLYRREVLEQNAIRYDLRYRVAADYDFTLRHVRASDRVQCLSKPICVFERGGTSYQQRGLARREQFQIRRAVYGSTLFAASVFLGQWALRSFRGLFPSAYWALRGGRR